MEKNFPMPSRNQTRLERTRQTLIITKACLFTTPEETESQQPYPGNRRVPQCGVTKRLQPSVSKTRYNITINKVACLQHAELSCLSPPHTALRFVWG